MRCCFADTYYWVAFLNRKDAGHKAATVFSQSYTGMYVTTVPVLFEVLNTLSEPHQRTESGLWLQDLYGQKDVKIIPLTDELQASSLNLFLARPDKEWSLTDCVSFVVMDMLKIGMALTADHHFVQAGYEKYF